MPNKNTIVHLNDDLKFLIACCQTEPSEEDINFIFSYLNAEHFELNALISLANQHGIFPLIYKTIKNLSQNDNLNATRSTLNAEILTELKAHYMSISQRNMLMSVELIRIMNLFEKNDIEVLAFKGPVLAQMAYGDITLRQYSDLDILVDESEIVQAGSVLDEHGYDPSFPIKILKNKTCLSSTNDLTFYNQSNGLPIELHWRLFNEKIGRNVSFRQISENKQSIMINGKSLFTLSTEILLVYLSLHGSIHAWERIEWICDIDRFIRTKKDLDWDQTISIAKEMDSYTKLKLGLLLSHTLFQTPLPHSMASSIQTDRIKTLESKTYELLNDLLAANEGYAKYNTIHMYQMTLLDTKLKKLKHFYTTYLSISKNDCQKFPLPASLKFLYIFIKPFRVTWKYLRYKK